MSPTTANQTRTLPEELFTSGLDQFPKVCKKCQKVYYDYSDWFAANILGTPMLYKGTQLLFFRGCRCRNTLAMSMDFSSVLAQRNISGDIEIPEELILELQDKFISEIPLWKATSGRTAKFKNVIINTTDFKKIVKMLSMTPGKLEDDDVGHFYDMKIPRAESCRLYTCENAEEFLKEVSKCLVEEKNFACGILYLTHENKDSYVKALKKIHQFDPLFQIITYSEEIASVKDLGLDDNYHNCFAPDDESAPFMLINRLNSYYYLQ